MRAVVCQQWGDPSVLELVDLPSPSIGPGQVRILVHACGVNFADVLMVAGQYQVRPPFPFSPGLEVAGEVVETGPDVTSVRVGMRVLALADYGGMAEEVVVPAHMVVPISDQMDMVTAAGFAVAYGTSHLALEHRARLMPGESLLVLGAAGGVGLTAVELGHLMGAKVIAAASTPEKLDLARQYGADDGINYTADDLRTRLKEITGGGIDVIFDPVGGGLSEQATRSLNWEGRLLVIGFASGNVPQPSLNIALVKNYSIIGLYWGGYASRKPEVLITSLQKLMTWYDEGRLRPHISHVLPLERAGEALGMLASRTSTGKVVVQVRSG